MTYSAVSCPSWVLGCGKGEMVSGWFWLGSVLFQYVSTCPPIWSWTLPYGRTHSRTMFMCPMRFMCQSKSGRDMWVRFCRPWSTCGKSTVLAMRAEPKVGYISHSR